MSVSTIAKAVTAVGAALLLQASMASAHGFKDCTTEAKDKWKTEKDAEAAATAAGYTVSKVKVEGSCYEVYAKDKAGKKFELFYNPVDLKLVKTQED
jgi:hypothetical protein